MFGFRGCVLGMLFLLAVSSCGSRGNEPVEQADKGEPDMQIYEDAALEFDFADLEFEEAGHVQRMWGFEVSATVGDRTYFFTAHDEEGWDFLPLVSEPANVAAIRAVEAMIKAVEGMVDLGATPLRIFWVDGWRQYQFRATTEVTINFDDMNTFGWFVYVWSGGSLPMWLSAGLEAVARADTGSFAPDAIGPGEFLLCDSGFAHVHWGDPIAVAERGGGRAFRPAPARRGEARRHRGPAPAGRRHGSERAGP